MKRITINRLALSISAAALLAACGGSQPPIGAPGAMAQNTVTALRTARSKSPIQHIVLVVQESRTFNDLFTTTKFGEMRVGHKTIRVKLKEVDLDAKGPGKNDYFAYLKSYRHGHMDGFNSAAYDYVNPSEIQPYFTLASEYGLADRMFQTQGSGDFTAHQDLIRGGTEISSSESLIDSPSYFPWGCDAGAVTSLITTNLKYLQFIRPVSVLYVPYTATLLDSKAVSWKYYTPPEPDGAGLSGTPSMPSKPCAKAPNGSPTSVTRTNSSPTLSAADLPMFRG